VPVPASPRPDGRRLGARIRLLREERGWSLRRAEEATGVSRAMLSQIELGTAAPTVPVLGRIAEGFGVSISQLVGGRPAATPSENVVVLPAAEQPVFRVPGTGFERRSLAPRIAGAVDLAVNHLPPGQSSDTFPAHRPFRHAVAAAVLRNPWHGQGYVADLQPVVADLAPWLGRRLGAATEAAPPSASTASTSTPRP
jgi:transcriptional regulator with XRE-family HTH domain